MQENLQAFPANRNSALLLFILQRITEFFLFYLKNNVQNFLCIGQEI